MGKIREERTKKRITSRWYYSITSLKYFGWFFRWYSINLKSKIVDIRSILNYFILMQKPRIGPDFDVSFSKNALMIVPTNICNAKCTFCANRFLTDSHKVMDFGTYKLAIDEYVKNNGRIVSLTPTVGDALVDKDIFKKISYAKENGLYVMFYTNGILLKDKIHELLDSDIDELLISLGDIDYRYESKLFGVSENLAKLKLENILSLLNAMKEKKSKLQFTLGFRASRSFNSIMHDMMKSEFMNFYNAGLFKIEYVYSYDNWGGKIKESDLFGVQKLQSSPKFRKYPCVGLYLLSVLPDGQIRLCGCRVKNTLYDDLIIGDIHTENLETIFNSKKRADIIENFCNGKFPDVCRDCSLYCPKLR